MSDQTINNEFELHMYNILWSKSGDIGIPGKIVNIECKNAGETMHQHQCGYTCVVSLLSLHRVFIRNILPTVCHIRRFWENGEHPP